MSDIRFACTACGQCCYGSLPLTVEEALEGAGTFPLAMSITPIKPGARGYKSIGNIEVSIQTPQRKQLSLLVYPISFVPPSMPCPNLTVGNLCSVHENKPLRCRTMPFFPYKDDDHQGDMLVPRKGWLCNTGDDAPVVYRNRAILERHDFDKERARLVKQAPVLRRYVNLLLQYDRETYMRILKAEKAPIAGRVLVGFVSFLRFNKGLDILEFARKQYPVLDEWANRTSSDQGVSEYNEYYRSAASTLERYL